MFQAVRALMIVGIVLGILGLFVCIFAMKCIRIGTMEDSAKANMTLTSGIMFIIAGKLCLSCTKHSAWNWGLSKASCPSGYRPFCWYELDFCSVKFCSFFCSVKVWKLLQKCKRAVHLKEPRFVLCGSQTTFLSDPRSVCHHWSVCVCQHAGHKLLDVHNQHVPGNAECPE